MATVTKAENGVASQPQKASLIATMAMKQGLEPQAYFEAVKATVFDSKGTKEELIAFLTVANKYDLNPFTKEIYAFPKKGGGIQPIVSIDGWANIVNSHPEFDGMEFIDQLDGNGDLLAVTCRMFRKDRSHPTDCTEYMAECKGASDPWRRWPRRMLRHKAMIQAARYAFGLAGIMDPDEAERAESVNWSQGGQQNGKVGVSAINAKLLDSMPSSKPSEPASDDYEGVDEAPSGDSTFGPGSDQYDNGPQVEAPPKTKQQPKGSVTETEADATTMRTLIERVADAETPMEINQVRDDIGALSLSKMQRAELDAMIGKRRKELGA